MDFFEQLKRPDLPKVQLPHVHRTKKLGDRLLGGYLKLFNKRLKPMKPIALVNDMPAYDLTQPPMDSEAGARVLWTGFDYVVRKRAARPITMVLMMTPACDMACQHCSARNYMRSPKKALSTEEIHDLIEQFQQMNGASVVLSGGEPTLHPGLLEIVGRVDKSKAVVTVFTNGARVPELVSELRSAGLFGTLVSLDSHDRETHDSRRNKTGAFDRAMRAVEAMQAEDMLVGLSTYISRPGMQKDSFAKIVKLGEELGVHQVFAFDAVPSGAILREQDWLMTPADRIDLREQIKAQNASPVGPAIMGQSWVNSPEGFGCFAGFYQMYVTSFGDVCPCDFTPITFGNIREEPLQKIWDRMRASDDWGRRSHDCRMQDACFRASTVDLIPDDAPWPVPYEEILALRSSRKIACGQ